MFTDEQLCHLLTAATTDEVEALTRRAQGVAQQHFGTGVFVRGLIEVSNYCKNDCLYCGIRRGNGHAHRYRLSDEQILAACENGYAMGFRTFVLQGGEDACFTDERLVGLIRVIRSRFPEAAITLSLGERSALSYRMLRDAGADRYLLRHETRDDAHYGRLHPAEMSAENRRECLRVLKELGFQTGTGMMVGTPYQTVRHLVEDIRFLEELSPEMIGIGPFVCASNTPFAAERCGVLPDEESWSDAAAEGDVPMVPSVERRVEMTVRLVAILRVLFPTANIPATTSLGTLNPEGRERAILAGANVVMPNLTPVDVRGQYALYDNKRCFGTESADALLLLDERLRGIGYHVEHGRGDTRTSFAGVVL